MSDLLVALVGRLEELGLSVEVKERPTDFDHGHDVDLVIWRGGVSQHYAMDLKRLARFSEVALPHEVSNGRPPILIGSATVVSPRSADAFRRADVQYVDASGNAWIHFGDVLIDVRGRRMERDSSESARGRGGNLFSAARAQVAFALLQWPKSWTRPQREVAEAAGVSLGQANDALTMFRESGFGPGGHRSHSELLDLWVASFPSGLGQKLLLATYRGSIEDFRTIGTEDPVFGGGAVVSGEFAADDLLRPAELTIYVAELDPLLPVKNRWRSDGEKNITVRRKFWTTPPDETQDSDGLLVGVRHAPAVLVYADLKTSENPRARSVAPEWRDRIARAEQNR